MPFEIPEDALQVNMAVIATIIIKKVTKFSGTPIKAWRVLANIGIPVP